METLTLDEREHGIQALQRGDLEEATRLLRGAVSANGRDAEAHAFLGIACSQNGAHEEAVRALQSAVELQPGEPRYRLNLGVALENAGEIEGAAGAYRELLKRFPAHPQARARLHALQPAAAHAPAAAAPWLQPPYPAAVDMSALSQEAGVAARPMSLGEAFGRRLAATLLDGVIGWVAGYVIGYLIGFTVSLPVAVLGGPEAVVHALPIIMLLCVIAGCAFGWFYSVRPLGRYGQTVGKMLLGIRVVGPDGGNPGLGRAALREIPGKFVSCLALGLGCLWMLWDPQQLTWHDKIAGTRVERI